MKTGFIILLLIFTHWVADFILQTDEMALNKSKSNYWLFIHVLVYSTVFLAPLIVIKLPYWYGVENVAFIFITFICHFITDYITSRITSKLYKEDKRHWFFVMIGFDQFLHYTQLILTYSILS